mmetsp:Transcript_42931/g.98552  ORF Transcript_42931/g.98552 Transcript_42931/m.98552 type:complete len:724 (+) Transcript_42931:61-2232(+)
MVLLARRALQERFANRSRDVAGGEGIEENSRVQVLSGRHFPSFSSGDIGRVVRLDREALNCDVLFEGSQQPVPVALRHLKLFSAVPPVAAASVQSPPAERSPPPPNAGEGADSDSRLAGAAISGLNGMASPLSPPPAQASPADRQQPPTGGIEATPERPATFGIAGVDSAESRKGPVSCSPPGTGYHVTDSLVLVEGSAADTSAIGSSPGGAPAAQCPPLQGSGPRAQTSPTVQPPQSWATDNKVQPSSMGREVSLRDSAVLSPEVASKASGADISFQEAETMQSTIGHQTSPDSAAGGVSSQVLKARVTELERMQQENLREIESLRRQLEDALRYGQQQEARAQSLEQRLRAATAVPAPALNGNARVPHVQASPARPAASAAASTASSFTAAPPPAAMRRMLSSPSCCAACHIGTPSRLSQGSPAVEGLPSSVDVGPGQCRRAQSASAPSARVRGMPDSKTPPRQHLEARPSAGGSVKFRQMQVPVEITTDSFASQGWSPAQASTNPGHRELPPDFRQLPCQGSSTRDRRLSLAAPSAIPVTVSSTNGLNGSCQPASGGSAPPPSSNTKPQHAPQLEGKPVHPPHCPPHAVSSFQPQAQPPQPPQQQAQPSGGPNPMMQYQPQQWQCQQAPSPQLQHQSLQRPFGTAPWQSPQPPMQQPSANQFQPQSSSPAGPGQGPGLPPTPAGSVQVAPGVIYCQSPGPQPSAPPAALNAPSFGQHFGQ